jgi:hypothetical protein
MEDTLIVVGMTCVSVVILVGIFALAWYLNKRKSEAWKVLANDLGLTMSGGGMFSRPEIGGIYQGSQTRIYTYTTGSGKNRHTYTRISLYLARPLNLGLRVYKEGFLSKIGKAIGTQDIQTGDEAFDAAVMIKGNDEMAVVDVLNPEVRVALAGLLTMESGAQLDDSGVSVTLAGWCTDGRQIKALLQGMAPVMQAIHGGGSTMAAPIQDGFRVADLPDDGDRW